MKKLTLILILLLSNFIFIAQKKAGKALKKDSLVWHTDLVKTNEISIKTKKPIFAFFTGSDWCGWCIKLQKDVFAKPEFVKWANKNVTLIELDFPRAKQLSPELQQQNNSLQQTFGVSGFPTVWIFNMTKDSATQKYNIIPFGSLGYPVGSVPGKEQIRFLRNADSIMKHGVKK